MYNKNIDTILLVSHYLTICKIKNPKSESSIVVQKFLTYKINKSLNVKKSAFESNFSYLSILLFSFFSSI